MIHRRVRWPRATATVLSYGLTSIWLVAPARAQNRDIIVVNNASARYTPMVAVHGQSGGDKCPDDAVPGDAPQTIPNVTASSSCQVAVFSKYRALHEVTPAWTAGSDSVAVDMGGNRLQVYLIVYIVTSDRRAMKWARSDLNRARALYNRNRAGITFIEMFVRQLSPADRTVIGDDCNRVDGLRSRTDLYKADRINVYYVDSIGVDLPRGANCFESGKGNAGGAPNVIYMSILSHSPTTLAHELGHAFGLQGATGHTGEGEMDPDIPGFTALNIMWTYLDADEARAQRHFSLGQVFRMNADDHSWLHLTKTGASAALPARPCHPSGPANRIPCPPLAFDVPGGGKPQ